jgi:hypothetical protein
MSLNPHSSRAAGTLLTANVYNTDHENHFNNVYNLMTGAAGFAFTGLIKFETDAVSYSGMVPRRIEVVDGTSAAPLTAMGPEKPSVYIERWEATDLTATGYASNSNILAAESRLTVSPPGKSPGIGSFVSFAGSQFVHAVGLASGDLSTHAGVWGNVFIQGDASNAFGLGLVASVTLATGAGQARGTGVEIGVVNNRADAVVATDSYLTMGAEINNPGTKKNTRGIYIHSTGPTAWTASGGAGGWNEGIRIEDIIAFGPGIILKNAGQAGSPAIQFQTTATGKGQMFQSGSALGMGEAVNGALFFINLANGQLSITDYTKAFPTLAAVTVGANDSGGAGFKVLRIPN